MPTPLLACLVAVALAGVVAALTPVLLRWLPAPPDEPDPPPFSDLDSPRFRWAVFAVAAGASGIALVLTEPSSWAVWAPFTTLGALLALVDLRTTYLPLRLNYLTLALSLTGAGLASWMASGWSPLLWAVGAGLGAAALLWLVWWFSGGRLGFGDVRLAGLIGVVAGTGGLTLVVWAFLFGTAVGAVWGIVARLRRGADGGFPYGPALMMGPLLALVLHAA